MTSRRTIPPFRLTTAECAAPKMGNGLIARGTRDAPLTGGEVHAMRGLRHHSVSATALAALAALFAVVAVPMCGGAPKQPMMSSTANTSGEGTVQAQASANGNTQLDVRVKHLSIPSKVAADASVYVVWIQPKNAKIQNVGALQIDENLVGALSTTTPHRAFTVTITPEPSSRMAEPTHAAVFSSEVTRTE
jgi:hypothetical protein